MGVDVSGQEEKTTCGFVFFLVLTSLSSLKGGGSSIEQASKEGRHDKAPRGCDVRFVPWAHGLRCTLFFAAITSPKSAAFTIFLYDRSDEGRMHIR